LHPELSAEDIEHIDSAGGFSLGEPHMHNLNVEKYVTSSDLIRPAVPVP